MVWLIWNKDPNPNRWSNQNCTTERQTLAWNCSTFTLPIGGAKTKECGHQCDWCAVWTDWLCARSQGGFSGCSTEHRPVIAIIITINLISKSSANYSAIFQFLRLFGRRTSSSSSSSSSNHFVITIRFLKLTSDFHRFFKVEVQTDQSVSRKGPSAIFHHATNSLQPNRPSSGRTDCVHTSSNSERLSKGQCTLLRSLSGSIAALCR